MTSLTKRVLMVSMGKMIKWTLWILNIMLKRIICYCWIIKRVYWPLINKISLPKLIILNKNLNSFSIPISFLKNNAILWNFHPLHKPSILSVINSIVFLSENGLSLKKKHTLTLWSVSNKYSSNNNKILSF